VAAVSDAGPLIWLGKYNNLNLLKRMYSEVLVPEAVYKETVTLGLEKGFKDAKIISRAVQDGWIKLCKPATKFVGTVKKVEAKFKVELGEVERQAIALSLEKNISTILTNDEDAYQVSKVLGLKPKGILYVLLESVKEKIINKTRAKKLFKQMLEDGFWLSPSIVYNFYEALDKI